MPESPETTDVRGMLEQAEHAASLGDLSTADELLEEIARVQEAGLGPLHPDLANTLNNRAIVAERTGRLQDAEAFYRRAVAIASASLPDGDPMVVASRQNLADFCAAHGLPLERPAVPPRPAAAAEPAMAVPPPAPQRAVPPPAPEKPAPTRPRERPAVETPPPRVVSAPSPEALPPATRRSHAVLVIAVAVVLMIGLLATRPWSRREAAQQAPADTRAAPQAVPSSGPPPVAPPPASAADERIPEPKGTTAEPERDERKAAAAPAGAPSSTPAAISLAAAELCQRFSPGGGNWECEPVGTSAAPGALVLYTRVRSPRDTVVVHRWYRGDALRKSVNLTIRANTTEGYRTYSRQTVDDPASWRVEVRTLDGDLLFERRVSTR